jgi:hypothetical protein
MPRSISASSEMLTGAAVGLSIMSVVSLVLPPFALIVSAAGCASSFWLFRRTRSPLAATTLAVCASVFLIATAINLFLLPAGDTSPIVGPAVYSTP